MAFDLASLAEKIERNGALVRVLIAEAFGSTPRDAGTAMLVWGDGATGTIGGGRLELDATSQARAMLTTPDGPRHLTRKIPLGPALGQCCGGAVTLLSEVFDRPDLNLLTGLDSAFERPLAPEGTLISEPFKQPDTPLWIYGAGHVGRAIVEVLQGLPFAITWVDTGADRFPDTLPDNVTPLVARDPARVVAFAPENARHLILTYSHDIDLSICHALLSHRFAFAGLIGSATKRQRFHKRLVNLGHRPFDVANISCPIGDKSLGKHPRAIAIGVAAQLLAQGNGARQRQPKEEALI